MDTVSVNGGFFSAIGLFEFVINAFLLLITDWLTDWLEVDGFLSALAAA